MKFWLMNNLSSKQGLISAYCPGIGGRGCLEAWQALRRWRLFLQTQCLLRIWRQKWLPAKKKLKTAAFQPPWMKYSHCPTHTAPRFCGKFLQNQSKVNLKSGRKKMKTGSVCLPCGRVSWAAGWLNIMPECKMLRPSTCTARTSLAPKTSRRRTRKVNLRMLKNGQGSISAILIVRSTQKEASPDLYQKAVKNKDGVLTVSVTSHTVGYKLDVSNMTLTTIEDEPTQKQLRVVSATGRSREIQEIRLHLSALSLQKSNVLEMMGGAAKASQGHHGSKQDCEEKCDDDNDDQNLALVPQEPMEIEGAEADLIANMDLCQTAEPEIEAEAVAEMGELPGPNLFGSSSEDEAVELKDAAWDFDDDSAVFILEDLGGAVKPSEAELPAPSPPTSVSAAVAGDKFETVPAFVFLREAGLTEIPNVIGCGIGIHHTTSTWQVRYPPGHQKSTARTFGHVKKGYVSSAQALLQCLVWAWDQHQKLHPTCTTAEATVKLLKGALIAQLGFHVKWLDDLKDSERWHFQKNPRDRDLPFCFLCVWKLRRSRRTREMYSIPQIGRSNRIRNGLYIYICRIHQVCPNQSYSQRSNKFLFPYAYFSQQGSAFLLWPGHTHVWSTSFPDTIPNALHESAGTR